MNAVYVLGNASIDLSFDVPRMPAAGETLMARGFARAPGGKGLNQAVVAVRSGGPVHFCAHLGPDAEAGIVRAALAAEGFASLLLPEGRAATDMSVLIVAPDGENCIVSTGDCAGSLTMADAMFFLAGIAAGDVLLLQGNLAEDVTRRAARDAAAAGARVVCNAAPLRWDVAAVVAHCEIVVVNEGEAVAATGGGDLPSCADTLLGWGAGIAIVTLGADGCFVAGPGWQRRYPAREVASVDTTGAGDTFCGVLAACLARDESIQAAIARAQAAAALTVARAGCFAALPTRAELAVLSA